MDQSSKRQIGTTNKDKIKLVLEQTITEKVRSILKESETDVEKQIISKMEQQKDDNSLQVKNKIQEVASNNIFKAFAQRIRVCRNLEPNLRDQYAQNFEELNNVFADIHSERRKIKIKINKFVQALVKTTFQLYDQLHDDFIRLEQAGMCGVGEKGRSFHDRYHEFEFKVFLWRALPEFENQNVEYQLVKPNFNEKEFRTYISDLIQKTYPDQVGDMQIVEKEREVIKYIEVPKIQIVEKVTTKEVQVPVVVEKIVERFIPQQVEVKVPDVKEVIKEVIKYIPQPDRIREAHEMLYGLGKPQNPTEALNIYYEEADVNMNVLACNAIGQIFLEGKFFPKDLKKAFQYYERSAAQNDPEGLFRIGSFLLKGLIDGHQLSQGRLDSRDKELEEGVIFFQKASEQGHLEAITDLGYIFEQGIKSTTSPDEYLIQPDLEQAEFYYTQGKKVRFPKATCLLGLFYLTNPGYREKVLGDNARKAIKYFELAKELGYPQAFLYLAQCYENGSGDLLVNKEKAKTYYKEGALRGDQTCKENYMFYIMQDASNSGRVEDYMIAYNYFRDILVSDPLITSTYFYLGHLYECGYGVSKDPKIAITYYFKGAKLLNGDCMNKLGDFYHSGYGVPRNIQEAIKWYVEAADNNNIEAMINLGTIYEDGIDGIGQDRSKAFHYYERASQLQCPIAFYYLGLMYEAGRYVNKDIKQAIECYKKAAIQGCQPARDLLEQKRIPMIYDDGINTAHVTLEESDGLLSAYDKQGLVGSKEPFPLITNPVLTHIGKKTNQNILQSKLEKQGDYQYHSILMQGTQTK